jgi:hypothetical protein
VAEQRDSVDLLHPQKEERKPKEKAAEEQQSYVEALGLVLWSDYGGNLTRHPRCQVLMHRLGSGLSGEDLWVASSARHHHHHHQA